MRFTKILIGHASEKLAEIPDKSVHCCITSPPYWGLRSYLRKDHPLKHLEIGCENTPQEYVAKLVEVFRGVKRVLRDDGVLWLNLGDSYARAGGTDRKTSNTAQCGSTKNTLEQISDRHQRPPEGFKEKDLVGTPWMVAAALREDGWYLRARCPWIKRNGMPESAMDRPTTVVEDIFLLSKSPDYFYDAEAVKLKGVIPAGTLAAKGSEERLDTEGVNARPAEYKVYTGTRLRRASDWFFESWQGLISDEDGDPMAFMVNTAAYPDSHFATFPMRLVIPMMQAGTSENGCCEKCGAPLIRVVESNRIMRHQLPADDPNFRPSRYTVKSSGENAHSNGGAQAFRSSETKGWNPSCECNAGITPCVVLDPFGGSGTVGQVARDANRSAYIIDLNDGYKPLIESRCLPRPEELFQ